MNNFKKLLENYHVRIPIIQRDYAQGRNDKNTQKIRKNFLETIFNALKNGKELHLDFVYGSIKNNIFTPLDGQQRLTTLFLLHWYFGENENNILKKFSYETRSSSREFCVELIKNIGKIKKEFPLDIEEDKKIWISKQIKDQSWFMQFWEQDPTVKSMLTMLDEICQKANEIEINPKNLDNLTFSLLKISDFGLDDDLYIKMNARGKPLNEFENFKAEFEKFLDDRFSNEVKNMAVDIDTTWTDKFFAICKDPEKTFVAMVNYRDFIFEMLFYKNNNLKEDARIEDIKEGKNDYSKVLKDIDDLEFIKFAFEKIDDILSKAKEIFDIYWDGKEPYRKQNKVCIFDDKEDNFYENEYKVFETMPTEQFNLDQKIYLYYLIVLIKNNESDENIVDRLTKIRNEYNDEVLYLRSNSVSFELNIKQNAIAKYVKKLQEKLENNVGINNETKKMQDYKYFKGNIDILEQDIELGKTIIELFSNYPTNIIIANLVYYGFEGWVLGKVQGNKDEIYYTKRLFGGQKVWHTMLRSKKGKDDIDKDFGGLKETFNEIKNNSIINFEKENKIEKYLKTKGIKKNTWQYYFIKYNEDFFENDERNIFAWYGTNPYYGELEKLGTSLLIEKISTPVDRNIKKTNRDENPFEKILRKKLTYNKKIQPKNNTITVGHTKKELNENYDIIEEIIKERTNK